MKFCCVFPGQGAQAVGMMAALAERYSEVEQTFAEASATLGEDLWQLVSEGPADRLGQTCNTQPALLASEIAIWRIWQARGGARPDWLAGHSFGEYTALVVAGALPFSDALALVRRRGELMMQAVPAGVGSMAAVLGLEDERIREICTRLSTPDAVVEAANFNAPGQVVLSGYRAAVEQAVAACQEAGARRAMVLDVSVPAHCSLMEPIVEEYAEALKSAPFATPEIPVINNVDVRSETEPQRIRDALRRQLVAPVRWTESIRWFAGQGMAAQLETGPGKILTGLLKRIHRTATGYALETPEGLEQALEAMHEE